MIKFSQYYPINSKSVFFGFFPKFYCFQGVEHKPSNIIYFDLIKQIYPGNSSYTVQTGGKLKSLRESTTIEKVRAYHKKYYRPENTYLTITGGIDPAMIFAALDPVERKLMEKMEDYPDWEKPFSVR